MCRGEARQVSFRDGRRLGDLDLRRVIAGAHARLAEHALYVEFSTIRSVYGLVIVALANSLALVAAYVASARSVGHSPMRRCRNRAISMGLSRPRRQAARGGSPLSDIHVVGGRYGFRLESGRSGTRATTA